MATMNISLPDKMKKWIEAQIETGRYANVSDYMRDLVRAEQDQAAMIEEIQSALNEGEASGYVPYVRSEFEQRIAALNSKANAA